MNLEAGKKVRERTRVRGGEVPSCVLAGVNGEI